MTWRLTKISGSTSTNTWRITNVFGVAGSSWRITALSGLVSTVRNAWRIARITGAVAGGWRITNVSGTVATTTTPVISLTGPVQVDPVWPFTVTALLLNSAAVSAYTFSVVGGTILSQNGNSIVVSATGYVDVDQVVVQASATSGALVSTPISITVPVRKGQLFRLKAVPETIEDWVTDTGEVLITDTGESLQFALGGQKLVPLSPPYIGAP